MSRLVVLLTLLAFSTILQQPLRAQDELRQIWEDTQTDQKLRLYGTHYERPPSAKFKTFVEELLRDAFEIDPAIKMEVPPRLNFEDLSKASTIVYTFGHRGQAARTELRLYSLLLLRKQTIGEKKSWHWEYEICSGTELGGKQKDQLILILTRLVTLQDSLNPPLKLNVYWREPTIRTGGSAREYRVFLGHSQN